jgi:Delta3-Delta2-enoyl-CoA isomerase
MPRTVELTPAHSYPMPTVALINGHAFAGGLMLAMFHDYRIQNPSKGFLCLNELEFGAPLKPPMASIFREKLSSPLTYRNMVIEAKRFTAQDALKEGIIDGLGGLDEALQLINQRNLIAKGKSASYRTLKEEMYRQTIGYLDNHEDSEIRSANVVVKNNRRAELERRGIRGWGPNL